MRALIIAFSTFTRVPMPRVAYNQKAMRHCICFFPIVGLFIGMCEAALYYLFCSVLDVSYILAACVLTVTPVLLTGGIHFDGYLDTMDARHSYRSKEEKLTILKDPHVGSFAVIRAILYFILYFGICYELLTHMTGDRVKNSIVVVYIFVIERVLSGLSVVLFPKAKEDGMLATIAAQADKYVAVWLVLSGILFTVVSALVRPVQSACVAGAALLLFVNYRLRSWKEFGGTTGDLAGHFLQTTELGCMIALIAYYVM